MSEKVCEDECVTDCLRGKVYKGVCMDVSVCMREGIWCCKDGKVVQCNTSRSGQSYNFYFNLFIINRNDIFYDISK